MTSGEYNFDDIFRQVPGGTNETDADLEEIPFPPVSYVLWIIFIVLMPTLLNNLLVGYYMCRVFVMDETRYSYKYDLKLYELKAI